MAKVQGSYGSVIGGVSEQVAQDRRSGQGWEQTNMVSDPVRGLTRRHGSIMQDEVLLTRTYTQADVDDLATYREFGFSCNGEDFSLLYAPGARAGKQTVPVYVLNKTTRKWVPTRIDYGSDQWVQTLSDGGASAVVQVGKYTLIAGNGLTPTYTQTNVWQQHAHESVVWIRGGNYSRTFTVTALDRTGNKVTVEYTTPSSSYQGVLDTSDIPALIDDPDNAGKQIANPNYSKDVADRTNAYNSAVTAWIGTAAAGIAPASIAANLNTLLLAQNVDSSVIGSTIVLQSTLAVVDDGGDGTLARAVAQEVTAPELVSSVHAAGKVVRVRPKQAGAEDAYYLQAVPLQGGATGWTDVSWQEAAGVQCTPDHAFCIGTVYNGTFYLAGSPARLQDLLPAVEVPQLVPSAVGDAITAPIPAFFGQRITYMGLFQDRLIVCAGASVNCSKSGDYFNFFRTTALSIDDDDPIEMYALGAEDDTIRSSTTFNRNLILFGERHQYLISGQQVLSAKSPSISIMASVEHAVYASPQASGNFIFFAKRHASLTAGAATYASSLHQFQVGYLENSPEAYEISKQLDRYLTGTPMELRTIDAPSTIILRTTGLQNGLYVYSYLDSEVNAQRVFDSWSRWTWDAQLGKVAGVGVDGVDILVYTARPTSTGLWLVADRFTTDSGKGVYPFMDSMRPYLQASSLAGLSSLALALDGTVDRALVGAYFDSAAGASFLASTSATEKAALWIGCAGADSGATWTPTNPFVRDRNDKAIVSGRLTLTKAVLSVTDTGGLYATVTAFGETKQATAFNGRIVGAATNLVGRQPLVTTTVSVPIGREVRECTYTVRSRDWLPLTVTGVEWSGQFFNNVRRV